MHRKLEPHVIGMLLMASVSLIFAGHDSISKVLIVSIPVVFMACARYFFQSVIIGAMVCLGPTRALPATRQPWLHLLRALFLSADSLFFLMGLAHISLAETTALIFLAPVFVTLFSPWFFGARISSKQWLSVIIGFTGVLIIINPSSDAFTLWYLSPILAAVFFALYQITTQVAAEKDPPLTNSFYVAVFSTLVFGTAAPFYWSQPSGVEWLLLFFLGCLGVCAHFLMSKSYRYASSAALAPLGYLQIVFATGFGILLYDAYPEPRSLIGIVLVCLSGLMSYAKRRPVPVTA